MARKGKDIEILMVDDDPQILVLLKRILQNSGFQTLEAASVAEGLKKAQSRHPHLILLDLQLPDQDGLSFLQKCKADPDMRDIPVVVFSAKRDQTSIYTAIGLGASDYVVKPIDASLLIHKIKRNLKAKDFRSHRFEEQVQPKISLVCRGQVSMATEVGLIVEAPIKIARETQFEIKSPFLQRLGCDDLVFFRSKRTSKLSPTESMYVNDVIAAGMSAQTMKRLRTSVQGLRAKA